MYMGIIIYTWRTSPITPEKNKDQEILKNSNKRNTLMLTLIQTMFLGKVVSG